MGLPLGGSAGAWMTRQAVRRGLLGSSRVWFGVFVATGAVKAARRLMRSGEAPTVVSEALRPGEGVEVRNLRPDRARRDSAGRG